MQSLAVTEALDAVDDLGPRLLACVNGLVVSELLLQEPEEAFHSRVVVGHAFTAHARRKPRFLRLLRIGRAGVLRALVAVVDLPRPFSWCGAESRRSSWFLLSCAVFSCFRAEQKA